MLPQVSTQYCYGELVISALFGLCRILQQACDKEDFCFLDPIGSCADPTMNVWQNTKVGFRILLDPARILEASYIIAISWDPRASIYIIK